MLPIGHSKTPSVFLVFYINFICKVSGASAGSIAALAILVDDTDIGAVASDILNLCIEARKGMFGPFSPSFDINKHLLECLHNNLPDDVHKIVSFSISKFCV